MIYAAHLACAQVVTTSRAPRAAHKSWQTSSSPKKCDNNGKSVALPRHPKLFQKCLPNGLMWRPLNSWTLSPRSTAHGRVSRPWKGAALGAVPPRVTAISAHSSGARGHEKSVGEQKLSDNAYRSLLWTLRQSVQGFMMCSTTSR